MIGSRPLAAGLLAAVLWTAQAASAASAPGDETGAAVERRLTLMGTEAAVRVEAADRRTALAASEAAVRALEAAERRLSTWTEESELARLNRAPVGDPVTLSPELAAELAAAEACRRATGGAFGAGVGPLVDAWGLRTGGRRPGPEELRAALAASAGEVVTLGPSGTATRRLQGSRIEEGGFGKGAALDAARQALTDPLTGAFAGVAVRSARLDLGGQVLFVGAGEELAVAHPADRGRAVLALSPEALAGRSAATSGNSERGIVVDGERLSHLLDPETGMPVPDLGSVTVLAGSGLEADCLSTGLYVMAARHGLAAALAWTEERAGVDAAFVRPLAEGGLEVVATSGLDGRVRVLDPAAVASVRIGEEPPARIAGIERRAGVADATEAVPAIPRPE